MRGISRHDQTFDGPAAAAGSAFGQAAEGASEAPRVVVLGGGFGGLATVAALAKAPVRITLVDRKNHHLFQPLLYQVATAGLAPGDIAASIRQVFRRQRNVTVAMAEIEGVDTAARQVRVRVPERGEVRLDYDFLVVATGVGPSYFGHDEFAAFAPGLKTIEDAITIRRRGMSCRCARR